MSKRKTTVNKQSLDKHAKMRALLELVIDRMPPGEKIIDMSAEQLVRGTEYTASPTRDAILAFEELGILSREGPEWGSKTNGMAFGRHYHWTRLMDDDEARQVLETWLSAREKDLVANRSNGFTKASQTMKGTINSKPPQKMHSEGCRDHGHDGECFPDNEGSQPVKDTAFIEALDRIAAKVEEPLKLLEAARQYANRDMKFDAQIEALAETAAELGITFDRSVLEGTFEKEVDPILETIGLVLPAFEDLERNLERLSKQNHELLEKSREIDALRRENDRLTRWKNDRVSAEVRAAQADAYSTH